MSCLVGCATAAYLSHAANCLRFARYVLVVLSPLSRKETNSLKIPKLKAVASIAFPVVLAIALPYSMPCPFVSVSVSVFILPLAIMDINIFHLLVVFFLIVLCKLCKLCCLCRRKYAAQGLFIADTLHSHKKIERFGASLWAWRVWLYGSTGFTVPFSKFQCGFYGVI